MGTRMWCWALALTVVATGAFAQGNPTGTISGQVTDPDDLALPGVSITVSSPVLQGLRTTVSSSNGDYLLTFLPPGDYTVTFELQGFTTVTRAVGLKMADRQPLSVRMALASLTEVVEVTATLSGTATTGTVSTTTRADMVERLPIGRTLEAATVQAPGAIGNGPGGNIMISGALSYDNLNLVNGVNVNENLRQQARPLYVEDAVQETKVSTGAISAEFGRFQGGVVNMVTKSGGNSFSGSFRTTFTNDRWRSLTPYPTDSTVDVVVPAYEGTFGGPVRKDKVWFFGAGRLQNNQTNETLPFTGYNYTFETGDKRVEGKLTYAINSKNTVKVSYFNRSLAFTNNRFGTILDAASLYNNKNKDGLLAANYQTALAANLFIEGQYSTRMYSNTGTGSQFTDLIRGTPIWDRSRGSARFNTATFCAACANAVDTKDNQDVYAKANYFLSTKRLGSHSIVAGFDYFNEMRMNNQNSVASGFRVQTTGAIIDGLNVYPILRSGTSTVTSAYIDYRPVFSDTVGNNLRTYSGFLNDAWRLNSRLSFNLGLRYDKNSTKDQGGALVGNADSFSPRLSAAWDVNGNGTWIANLSFGHYVGMFNTQIADAASAAGREANYSFWYQGPEVNTGATGPYLTSAEALKVLFDWFNANGGTSRALRATPTVPGVNTAVDPGVRSANSNEFVAGVAHQLGQKGAVRADLVYRRYYDFYGNYVNLGTGSVTDPRTNLTFNKTVVDNTNDVRRDYKGLSVQFDYRLFKTLNLNGNWMMSWSKGSVEGEDVTNGATRASANEYPQYREASWNYPLGYTNGDQRHKVRLFGTYDLPLPAAAGAFALGFMQRFDSGAPWDYNLAIDPRPYVANPGYLVPPASVTYFMSGRGEFRFEHAWRSDLSLSWNHRVVGGAQIFLRAVANNVFNNQALTGFNTTIVGTGLQTFNPFTSKPVEGVNWQQGPEFGKASSPTSYQSPRDFNVSVGVRF